VDLVYLGTDREGKGIDPIIVTPEKQCSHSRFFSHSTDNMLRNVNPRKHMYNGNATFELFAGAKDIYPGARLAWDYNSGAKHNKAPHTYPTQNFTK
jgi:hypothetical protein